MMLSVMHLLDTSEGELDGELGGKLGGEVVGLAILYPPIYLERGYCSYLGRYLGTYLLIAQISKLLHISQKSFLNKRLLILKTISFNLRVWRFIMILRAGAPFNFRRLYVFYIRKDLYLSRHHFPTVHKPIKRVLGRKQIFHCSCE